MKGAIIEGKDEVKEAPSENDLQNGKLLRAERYRGKQEEADEEAHGGGSVEAAEDQEAIPSADCRAQMISIRRPRNKENDGGRLVQVSS